jgi:hypothetical protein
MLLITAIHIKTQLGWSFRRQMYFVQGFFCCCWDWARNGERFTMEETSRIVCVYTGKIHLIVHDFILIDFFQ